MAVVVVDHGEFDERQLGKHHVKHKILIPDGIERVLVERLRLLLGAVAWYAEDLDLDKRARCLQDFHLAAAVLVPIEVVVVVAAVGGRVGVAVVARRVVATTAYIAPTAASAAFKY